MMDSRIEQAMNDLERAYYAKRDECALEVEKKRKETTQLMTNQVAYEGMAMGVRSAIDRIKELENLPVVGMDKVVPIRKDEQ